MPTTRRLVQYATNITKIVKARSSWCFRHHHLHVASSDVKGGFSRFDGDSNNGMLGEVIDVLKVGMAQGT